jgi:hypothetical protein
MKYDLGEGLKKSRQVHDSIIAQMFYSTRGLRKNRDILRLLMGEG